MNTSRRSFIAMFPVLAWLFSSRQEKPLPKPKQIPLPGNEKLTAQWANNYVFIAGEKLNSGQCVFIGKDGKAYRA